MPTKKKDTTIPKLRKEIDTIDDRILDLLIERAGLVSEVGKLKPRDLGKSIIRPGREAEMIRRVARKTKGPVSKAAVALIWRLIIASAINIEENAKVSALAVPGNRECYWLAREYFGAFTEMLQRPTIFEVLQDITDRVATVGVLPLVHTNAPRTWWSRLTETKNPPHVFARVPFIRLAHSQKGSIVAIGHVDPEPTENDRSLWVVKAEEPILFSTLSPLLEGTGLNFTLLQHCKVLDVATKEDYLLEVEGFVGPKDPRIKEFLKRANGHIGKDHTSIEAFYLGAYAVPIDFEEERE